MKTKLNLLIIFFLLLFLTSCNKNHTDYEKRNKDIIINAYNKHINSKYFKVEGSGVIKSSLITQNIKVIKRKDGENLYYYNASFGSKLGIKVNNYVKAKGTHNSLVLSKGLSNKSLEISKENSSENITHDDFVNLYGVGINDFNYIINQDTIIDVKEDVTKSGNNTFIVSLDLEKSTKNYKKHISETNPYENDISKTNFKSIKLIIKLNSNNYFDEITYIEEYDVSVNVLTWIKQSLKAEIKETYTYEREED